MKKCPNGMFAEIKYDGERVQVHKQGDQFQYFSRSLKPVQAHKVCSVNSSLDTTTACPSFSLLPLLLLLFLLLLLLLLLHTISSQVSHVKDYLPEACPHGESMILDGEVLMVDLKSGDPLPFGTLGIHKVHV